MINLPNQSAGTICSTFIVMNINHNFTNKELIIELKKYKNLAGLYFII